MASQASGWAQQDLIRWDCCPLWLKLLKLGVEPTRRNFLSFAHIAAVRVLQKRVYHTERAIVG